MPKSPISWQTRRRNFFCNNWSGCKNPEFNEIPYLRSCFELFSDAEPNEMPETEEEFYKWCCWYFGCAADPSKHPDCPESFKGMSEAVNNQSGYQQGPPMKWKTLSIPMKVFHCTNLKRRCSQDSTKLCIKEDLEYWCKPFILGTWSQSDYREERDDYHAFLSLIYMTLNCWSVSTLKKKQIACKKLRTLCGIPISKLFNLSINTSNKPLTSDDMERSYELKLQALWCKLMVDRVIYYDLYKYHTIVESYLPREVLPAVSIPAGWSSNIAFEVFRDFNKCLQLHMLARNTNTQMIEPSSTMSSALASRRSSVFTSGSLTPFSPSLPTNITEGTVQLDWNVFGVLNVPLMFNLGAGQYLDTIPPPLLNCASKFDHSVVPVVAETATDKTPNVMPLIETTSHPMLPLVNTDTTAICTDPPVVFGEISTPLAQNCPNHNFEVIGIQNQADVASTPGELSMNLNFDWSKFLPSNATVNQLVNVESPMVSPTSVLPNLTSSIHPFSTSHGALNILPLLSSLGQSKLVANWNPGLTTSASLTGDITPETHSIQLSIPSNILSPLNGFGTISTSGMQFNLNPSTTGSYDAVNVCNASENLHL